MKYFGLVKFNKDHIQLVKSNKNIFNSNSFNVLLKIKCGKWKVYTESYATLFKIISHNYQLTTLNDDNR